MLERIAFFRKMALSAKPIQLLSGGKITGVAFNTSMTKFDVSQYVVASKKSRKSMGKEVKIKTILHYYFVGICISFKKRAINSSFVIRNVLSLFPVEMSFPAFSPLIANFGSSIRKKDSRIKANKLLYLREKPATKSIYKKFRYVLRS
jgi:ribosomal protein L19